MNMKPPQDCGCESLVPFARLLFWIPMFDPQPQAGRRGRRRQSERFWLHRPGHPALSCGPVGYTTGGSFDMDKRHHFRPALLRVILAPAHQTSPAIFSSPPPAQGPGPLGRRRMGSCGWRHGWSSSLRRRFTSGKDLDTRHPECYIRII